MQELCDELLRMLNQMPTYASWAVNDLEKVFVRYKEIVHEMIDNENFAKYKWLANLSPDLHERIKAMLAEKNMEKQNRQFNNIVFELRCAIEVITGTVNCREDQWPSLLSGNLSATG